jgi:hypothetical protein
MEWIANADKVNIFRHEFHCTNKEVPDYSKWRTEGFRILHHISGPYPGLLRHVEEISIKVTLALGKMLCKSSTGLRRPALSGVEMVSTLPSGVRWAFGWAYDGQDRGELLLGCSFSGKHLHGGITYIQRTDIAQNLNNLRALKSGFSIPIPKGGISNDQVKWTFVVQRSVSLRQQARCIKMKARFVVNKLIRLLWVNLVNRKLKIPFSFARPS